MLESCELAAKHLALLSRISPQRRLQNLQPWSTVFTEVTCAVLSGTKAASKHVHWMGKSLRNCGNEARKCSAPGSTDLQEPSNVSTRCLSHPCLPRTSCGLTSCSMLAGAPTQNVCGK